MQVYLVGGAVRDKLLGIKNSDRDYCVTGSTPQEMLQQGFSCVGNDFPVFLHPQTKCEYALARTERKQGHGYKGFICDFTPEITLEQDLERRDLTINAIAEDEHGQLIDPFHGQEDLQRRILRHIGPAFREDPLRVLRLARFYARFAHFGFQVADETKQLCAQMVASGELSHLTAERIWLETEKALATDTPELYFYFLRDCGALAVVFPQLYQLNFVKQDQVFHPEGNVFIHTMMTLQVITKLSKNIANRFAMLVHDFGKLATDPNDLPHHPNHQALGVPLVKEFCKALRIPKHYSDYAVAVSSNHSYVSLHKKDPKFLLDLFQKMQAFRNPDNIANLALCLSADYWGRGTHESPIFWGAYDLMYIFTKVQQLDIKAIVASGLQGLAIKAEMNRQRLELIKQAQQDLLAIHQQ